MPIVYSVVTANGAIVAECTLARDHDFRPIVNLLLERIVLTPNMRKSYTHENLTFNYIVSPMSVLFLCVSDKEFPTRISFAYLQNLMAEYAPLKFNEEFLRSKMDFYSNDPKADKILTIKKDVEAAREVMVENIEAVLKRGEKLDDLLQKTDMLATHATTFQKGATKLKKHMWWMNVKLWLVIGAIVAVILLVIIWIACGLTFQRCRP
ncbi:R-SNARE protein [Pelomyxa schiedti]|nr:R-SNARE protein [Pelomyxa schiedti]